jgi:cell wall-associated NlpC family hydrolase
MKYYLSILKSIFVYCSFLFVAQAQTTTTAIDNTSTQQETIGFRKELIDFAKSYLGTPYLYGSSNPTKGFDCSGFVNYVFNKFNVIVPRVSREFKDFGKKISPEEFQIGDILVFYGYEEKNVISHLGIICESNGMKSKFIHSSSGKVKEVVISSLDSKSYTQRFYKCIKVVP